MTRALFRRVADSGEKAPEVVRNTFRPQGSLDRLPPVAETALSTIGSTAAGQLYKRYEEVGKLTARTAR